MCLGWMLTVVVCMSFGYWSVCRVLSAVSLGHGMLESSDHEDRERYLVLRGVLGRLRIEGGKKVIKIHILSLLDSSVSYVGSVRSSGTFDASLNLLQFIRLKSFGEERVS